MKRILALVHAWLLIDFFADSRRSGQPGSTLTTAVFGQSFLGLVLAALTLPDVAKPGAIVPYAAANLSLSTLLMGMSVLGDTQRVRRRRADEVLVHTAPVGRAELVLARALHGGFSLALITIGIALPPAILSYWVAGHTLWVVPAYLALACALAGLFASCLTVAIGACSRWLGTERAALLGGTAKSAILGGGFAGFALCMQHLSGTADDLPIGRQGAEAWPAYWAAKLLADEHSQDYGLRLLAAGSAVFLGALLLQRPPTRRRQHGAPRSQPLLRLLGVLAPRGPLRGLATFTATMLYRSPGFRARVLPLFGMPVAMVGLSLWDADPRGQRVLVGLALQFPAIYLPLLTAFLPHSDQEGGRWLFATSPPGIDARLARNASLLALTTHLLLPIHTIGVLLMLACGLGLGFAVALGTTSLGLAVLAGWMALRGLAGIPFTDDSEATAIDPGTLFAFAAVLGLAGGGCAVVAGEPLSFAVAAMVSFAAWRVLRAPTSVTLT